MRCPTCGTQNAPDSRFCGGCGMPVSPPERVSRVAPTAKIPDDAPIALPTRPGPLSGQHPNVSYAPPAMPTPPPGSLQQAAIPPTSQRRPHPQNVAAPYARAVSRAPVDSGSSFAAPVHTPLGLIAIVLLLDLVLAGTGAFLLAKGLSKPAKAATKDEPAAPATPPQTSEVAPPAAPAHTPTLQTPHAAPPEAAAVAPPANAEPAKPAPAKPEPAPASARRPNVPATPPAKTVSTEAEIATKVMGSRTAFGICREQAGEVHGNIDIAFRVLGDGGVGNVSVVEDTTGSATLAACLRDTIASWKVTPHNGAPLSFVRPFTYP